MKRFTKTIPAHEVELELFEYSELDDEGQENADEWFLSGRNTYDFSSIVQDDLRIVFPHSDMDVHYSLNYCQGDGLGIYGRLVFADILELVKDGFTEKELRTLDWIGNDFKYFDIEESRYYYGTFCDYEGQILDLLYGMRDIPYELIKKFVNKIESYIGKYCYAWSKEGYKFFYEPDEEEIEQYCADFGIMFEFDGTPFYDSDLKGYEEVTE